MGLGQLSFSFSVLLASASFTAAHAQCETDLLRPSSLEAFDAFGWSLVIQNNQLAIGCIADDDMAINGGAVYVFGRTQIGWLEGQKLAPSDLAVNNEFGNSLAIDGNVLLVGSHKQGPGAVYVFEGMQSGFVQVQKLNSSDGLNQYHFGHAVSLEGDTALIGQMRDEHAGFEAGSAYIFERVAGSFVEARKLTASDAGVGDRFGRTVDLAGDTAIACAHKHNAEGGAAYIYTRDDMGTPGDPLDDTWDELQKLVPNDNVAADRFGRSLSISNGTAFIGATGHGATGAVYVFEQDDNGTPGDATDDSWSQVDKLVPADGQATDAFGMVCQVEGDLAMIGSPKNDEASVDGGAIYVYQRTSNGWTLLDKLLGSDLGDGDMLGDEMSVDITGDDIAATAWANDGSGLNSGSAYVWKRPAVSYCVSKTNSQGCEPTISASGNPSLTDAAPYEIVGNEVLNFRNGLLFYGIGGKTELPFLGGTLCVIPPLRRTPIQNSAGNTPPTVDCSGQYVFDFNNWVQSGLEPNLQVGGSIHAQFWSRDPASTSGVGLTNALEAQLCP